MSSIITLTTDFGLYDGYVGAMKGVILGINSNVSIVDLSHEIPPQDIQEAAYLLWTSYRFFPRRTIHVAVVDPGVGTERPAIIVDIGDQWFVGPDNGIFAYIYQDFPGATVTYITNRSYCLPQLSRTFHGRDVFAPVAAHLSLGTRRSEFGPELSTPVRGEVSSSLVTRDYIKGQVVHVDRFGNAITNISESQFLRITAGQSFRIEFKDMYVDCINDTYGDVAAGETLAVMGSAGMLEISVNGGNAAHTLGLDRTTDVSVVIE
jgi:S-adenosyl-L-methionine hydrolase (adenosine-forming)